MRSNILDFDPDELQYFIKRSNIADEASFLLDNIKYTHAVMCVELGLRWLHDRAKESKAPYWSRDPSGRWSSPKTTIPKRCSNEDCYICNISIGRL